MTTRTKLIRTAAIGLAATALQAAAPASATMYVIDDFNTAVSNLTITTRNTSNTSTLSTTTVNGQHDPFTQALDNLGSNVFATTPNAYTIGGFSFKRDLTFAITQDPSTSPLQKASITLAAASGNNAAKLTTTTGSMVSTSLNLSYDISSLASLILGANGGDASFTVLYSDGVGTAGVTNPTTVTAKLDGTAAGTSQALNVLYGPSSGNGYKTLNFTLPLSMVNGVDRLTFDFTGPAGYDLSIGAIGLTTPSPAADSVPEPAMLGLFGLGAMGLGFARRRKR